MLKAKHSLATPYILLIILYYIFITEAVNSSRYMMAIQSVVIVFAILDIDNYRSRNKIKTK